MRRLASIACLLLLVLTICGHSLVFEVKLAEIRTDMRSLVEEGGLAPLADTFRFDATALHQVQWLEDGREFEWNSGRYDVLSSRKEGSDLVVVAISDSRETDLLSAWHTDGPKNESSRASYVLLKLLSLPYITDSEQSCCVSFIEKKDHNTEWSGFCPLQPSRISTPPPRMPVFFS